MKETHKEQLKTLEEYLKTLFDFSFSRYITIQMLPAFYFLIIVACAVGVFMQIIDAFSASLWRGLFYVALAPFVFVVLVSLVRAVLEFLVVIFRIAEDVEKLSGMRESVDKITGLTDFAAITNRLPFVRHLQGRRSDDTNKKASE